MVFLWSLSNSKSSQVSRTLLSILAVINNAIVWMVSTRPPTSKSSSPFSKPLVTVPKAPITIGMSPACSTVFFNSLARSRYLSFCSRSFCFIRRSAGTAKSTILQFLFFCWLLVGLVFRPRFGDPSVCQSPIGVYVCYFLGQVLGLLLLLYILRDFQTSVSRWSFTGVWVTTSHLESSGLFSVFWPILIFISGQVDGLYLFFDFQVFQSLYRAFGNCSERTNYNWYHRHFHVPLFFSSLAMSRYLSLFSLSFIFTVVHLNGKVQYSRGSLFCSFFIFIYLFIYLFFIYLFFFFFFCDYHQVWSSWLDLVTCLYLEIRENLLRLILQDEFWDVYMPLACIAKFKLLAQFPVDHLPHSVVSSFILFMR